MIKTLMTKFGSIKAFSELELLNKYLAVNQYPYVMVYFTAKWNPACALTDEHVKILAS